MLDLSSPPQDTESARRSPAPDDLLAAAEGDAAEIVNRARAEIADALLRARHDLVVLTAQLGAGLDLADSGPIETSPARQAAADARRDLLQALHEARPDLGALSVAVRAIGGKPPSFDSRQAGQRLLIDRRAVAVGLIVAAIVMSLGFWVGLGTPDPGGPISEPVATRTAELAGGPGVSRRDPRNRTSDWSANSGALHQSAG
jgi:hypothetical protein